MSNNAMQLAKHKTELLAAALELYKGNRQDPGYVKAEAEAEKMFKKEMSKLRKRERETSGKPLSEKLQQVEDLNLPGEKNAALTKEQKASFKLRKQGGSSASEIMKKEQQGAVTAGAKRKEGEDATGVEGVPFGRFRTHTNSFLQQDEPIRNAFARIHTHSLRICTHSFAF